jgi:hypothetical protein
MEVRDLYLSWEDQAQHRWFPVGKLSYNKDTKTYCFKYLKGALESKKFVPFSPMSDLEANYESEENSLFPFFSNRLLAKSRPEYKKYIEWLNLTESQSNPFLILAITGGIRETDKLEVFQCPLKNGNGRYEVTFLSHGLRHLPDHCISRVNTLEPGEKLYLMRDVQNPFDAWALALRTSDPVSLVGYCPRYLVRDFDEILKTCEPNSITVKVEKVNRDAPLNLRILCKLVAPWPKDFMPCSSKEYKPISEE